MPKFQVSQSPHIRAEESVPRVMLDVAIALLPALAAATYFFGGRVVWLTALAVLTAVATEAAVQKLTGRPVTVSDWSAVVTGLLLAYNLRPSVPWWLPIVGSALAVAVVKHAFGGLGRNFMNPALAARAILLSAWPVQMTGILASGTDGVSTATPLSLLKEAGAVGSQLPSLWNVFIGNIDGSIGEISTAALLLGAVYLFHRRVINWRIPVTFVTTVVVLAWVFGGRGLFTGNGLFHVMVGGVVLGAFYMATDYSTSPVTPRGQVMMGTGCGMLTVLIRLYGVFPEGVSYSILLMNLMVPLIERYTRPRPYGMPRTGTGWGKRRAKKQPEISSANPG